MLRRCWRERSRLMSEMLSEVTSRVVASYTNGLTVKLWARARDEDGFVREAVDEHTHAYRRQLRMTSAWGISLIVMNAALLTGTAMAFGIAWQTALVAGLGLALSSTAIALQSIHERNLMRTASG